MFEPIEHLNRSSALRAKLEAPNNRCVHYHPTAGRYLDVISEETGAVLSLNDDCIPARIRRVIDSTSISYYKAHKARGQAKAK